MGDGFISHAVVYLRVFFNMIIPPDTVSIPARRESIVAGVMIGAITGNIVRYLAGDIGRKNADVYAITRENRQRLFSVVLGEQLSIARKPTQLLSNDRIEYTNSAAYTSLCPSFSTK